MAAESLLAERQARRDLSHTMPADRHRGNNQAYHIVHKLIVGWTTWKMRMAVSYTHLTLPTNSRV